LDTALQTFPNDDCVNPTSYLQAIEHFERGDVVTIFTPDDTHFDIALACIRRGLHVMITKPAVKTLEHHKILDDEAKKMNVLVGIEVHKRWDPIYTDARDRIQAAGPFSYLYSYMSQPKHQLDTFRAWAGKSSDISYYLNSHHVDFHEWCVEGSSRPVLVTACASTGVATTRYDLDCEDTITLTVQWENMSAPEPTIGGVSVPTGSKGTAIYTSSWIAAPSDVHSQQRFFYMGQVRYPVATTHSIVPNSCVICVVTISMYSLCMCCVVWCGVVWCGVVWCGVVWCGVVLCGVVWCGVVWCGVVWCGVVWCGVVWCGVAWCGVVT
jgi:D-galacturonate reductase